MTRTFQEYQAEKREREWNDKVAKQKAGMNNEARVKRATAWKKVGNEKVQSGNLPEARDYYREAVIYVEDLVDARRTERNELLAPLYCNLALVHFKLNEYALVEDVVSKLLAIADVPRNNVKQSFKVKALFRRGQARHASGKLEESKEDLVSALRLEPESADISQELASVREKLSAQAKESREKIGGFFNRQSDERHQREEKRREQEEKRRKAEELRKERRFRAEQKQQMQQAFQKISEGKMLYEQREKEMEPVRQKEKEKRQTLELERDLLNIIDDSKGLPKTNNFDEFMQKKEATAVEQSDELDQKKKVLDKIKKEETWVDEEVWKGQRDEHRKRIMREKEMGTMPVGPSSMWEARDVKRWCDQRITDMLVCLGAESEELTLKESAAALGTEKGKSRQVLKALITDVLKLEGDAAVMKLNPHKPALFYYDYFIKLDWEVAVCSGSDTKAYRTAEELISIAAKIDDGKAPPSVCENRILAGTFKTREFCSEEEPSDGAWPLKTKIKKPCSRGAEVEAIAFAVRDKLLEKVQKALCQWTEEYRKHWALD
mmetsp:Transcript_12541/g.20672  ORF Transcript_12541/g.20672 Transcript_12541/m.20672 type:complete len:549 (-) Transcript_12541:340-1986(-)|eukprot:CAMPEP_0169068160 /NCGR_PEP_ID=MMETSP1015-20121227/3871_1 /TAXON_ID=342587 /ORGANISM="Karlodinium micrum, Strain CCMP2283" /LENGTH=548 /DNA_ID=CAMNT_0009126947 /DNA_START=70 /DNA_END=1716 /DNA_ORIENTATION=-